MNYLINTLINMMKLIGLNKMMTIFSKQQITKTQNDVGKGTHV